MNKREFDFNDVRQLCAYVAAKDEIQVVVVKRKKHPIIHLLAQRKKLSDGESNIEGVKALDYVLLNELNVKGRDGLMKRMSNVLRGLKTTDLDTGKAFLQLERYAGVRQEIIQQLDEFVVKDLKMVVKYCEIHE